MLVGVVALRYVIVLITECHNSHKHSQSPLTTVCVDDIYLFHTYLLPALDETILQFFMK